MRPTRSLLLSGLAVGLGSLWGCFSPDVRFCYGDGLCIEPDGQKVLEDGQPVCELTNSCGDLSGAGPDDDQGGGDRDGTGADTDNPPGCVLCGVSATDSDGDCIPNDIEDSDDDGVVDPPVLTVVGSVNCFDPGDTEGETDPNNPDTDNDGVPDGCEDSNRDGGWQIGEMVPFNRDSDCDGIIDGVEDPNHDGIYQPNSSSTWIGGQTCTADVDCNTESWCAQGYCDDGSFCDATHTCVAGGCTTRYLCSWCTKNCDTTGDPCVDSSTCGGGTCLGLCGTVRRGESLALDADTDRDGILDGAEDRDGDGFVDPWIDLDDDGCYDRTEPPGESDARSTDSDGDQIPDQVEDSSADPALSQNGLCDGAGTSGGETCAWDPDSDCDFLDDGFEDLNRNGFFNSTETNPKDRDTDNDFILDGVEDANGDGVWQSDETDPRLPDTDGDRINDGVEDANRNGVWDYFDDSVTGDGDGCWDFGEAAGELNPRLADTDGDGVSDTAEDGDANGRCAIEQLPDSTTPTSYGRIFESCAFLPDTDCDGLNDGLEDVNHDGIFQTLETDPRRTDSDNDGLQDGCPAGFTQMDCEDLNNNGRVDAGESDAARADSDGDGLTDGCERRFGPPLADPDAVCDPLLIDSDDDGVSDGDEDINHNCLYEPGVDPCQPTSSCPETDPRVADEPPAEGTPERAQWEVCATTNLKDLTFASSARETHDYQLAFEVEKAGTGDTCTLESDCGTGERCDNHHCVLEARYYVKPFGLDPAGDGFNPTDETDPLFGHVFQSPRGVVEDPAAAATGGFANRDIYGFVIVKEEGGSLNSYMQDLWDGIVARTDAAAYPDSSLGAVTQIAQLASQPTHDSLPSIEHPEAGTYPINFAQLVFRVQLRQSLAMPPLFVRNELLESDLFAGPGPFAPADVPPVEDPVYGDSMLSPQFVHRYFTVYLSVVQREAQIGTSGQPGVAVVTLALTPDNRCTTVSSPCNPTPAEPGVVRLYNERISRLEDLSGGSALARFPAGIGNICEQLDYRMAVADLLWVVDDSKSMQQNIGRLEQASRDAKAILTANSGIVGFRVAMTTTNPSPTARAGCQTGCDQTCANGGCSVKCEDRLGCYKVCPAGCAANCTGTCDTGCNAGLGCFDDAFALEDAIEADVTSAAGVWGEGDYAQPGGGGTFYYEDTFYLDCDSVEASGSINSCNGVSGFDPFFNGCPDFSFGTLPSTEPRCRLLEHAGFLGSDIMANCDTYPVCLRVDMAKCATAPFVTCQRLAGPCTDGPTVLASQMCDLIRAMGGIHQAGDVDGGSTRAHSAPEHGTRGARRLIESMLPALPANYDAICGAPPCTYDSKKHLRLACEALDLSDTSCQACDPRVEDNCELVPLLTIFLSDEEDSYFKDDCRTSAAFTDRRQLPDLCVWLDGDPTTFESCDPCELRNACANDGDCMAPTSCTGINPGTGFGTCTCDTCEQDSTCLDDGECVGGVNSCRNGLCACATDADCSGATSCIAGACRCDRRAYCEGAGYYMGQPLGYQPDLVGATEGEGFTYQFSDPAAPECAAVYDTSLCPGYPTTPCPAQYIADAIGFLDNTVLPYSCATDPCAGQQDQAVCEHITMDIGAGPEPYCVWNGAVGVQYRCMNRCGAHSFVPGPIAPQKCACAGLGAGCATPGGDPFCRWEQGYVSSSESTYACMPKYEVNDCRACKRLSRMLDAAEGVADDPNLRSACTVGGADCFTDTDCASGTCVATPLIGFNEVGRVYSIVREKGVQGFGGNNPADPEDQCGGGDGTWGLGDGEAYRELSLETGGRQTNVCAASYTEFMSQTIKDIAALSAPYRLLRTPIAATIQVGIARPVTSGSNCPGGLSSECPTDQTCVDLETANNVCVTFDFVPVPRSQTQGFYFSAITNSIAFTSDPVDGVCETGDVCSAGNGLEDTEIMYAQSAPGVPRPDDMIYVSYRYWQPVPCLEMCLPTERCERIICYQEPSTPSCAGDVNCPLSYTCNTGTNECELNCTPGELVDRCVEDIECPNPCESWDVVTEQCQPINDPCVCNPTGADPCTPGVLSSCPMGYACDENCSCVPVPGCGGGFTGDTSLAACLENLACCDEWSGARTMCQGPVGDPLDQAECTAQPAAVCTLLGLDGLTCTAGVNAGQACAVDAECSGGQCLSGCVQRPPCQWNIVGSCDDDGSACTTDNECGVCELDNAYRCTVAADCPTGGACVQGVTCNISGGFCDFRFPTCCGNDEVADCFADPETGEASLFCRQECTCSPPCTWVPPESPEICEFVPGLNSCDCFTIPP